MGNSIEERSNASPAFQPPEGYEKLFDLGDRVEEMRGKDMEMIIHEVCSKDRDAQLRRKFIVLELREKNQDEQNQTSNAKVEEHRKLYGVYFDGAATICAFGAAFGGPVAGLMQIAQKAFEQTSNYRQRISQGEIEIYTHRYSRVGSLIQEESQQIQTHEKDSAQMHAKIDQTLASIQRIFELMASATS